MPEQTRRGANPGVGLRAPAVINEPNTFPIPIPAPQKPKTLTVETKRRKPKGGAYAD